MLEIAGKRWKIFENFENAQQILGKCLNHLKKVEILANSVKMSENLEVLEFSQND